MSVRRVYETTVIINAALEEDDIDGVLNKITSYIENNGGNLQEKNKWGRRRLAYPINKKFNGFYVHLVYDSNPQSIPLLERFLILEDTVLRHLTLELPDKLRDFRKQRALAHGKADNRPDDMDEKKGNAKNKADDEESKEVKETESVEK